MMKKHIFPLLLLGVILSSCKKDKEEPATPTTPPNEEEVITSLIISFVDTENTDVSYHLEYRDADGPGGQDPVITSEPIEAGRYYAVNVSVWNESVAPAVDLTGQIVAEADEHQFFFETTGIDLAFSNFNADANGHPLGTSFNSYPLGAGEGTLKVTLRHGPDKEAEGVAEGDITNAGGETDIEAVIPVTVF